MRVSRLQQSCLISFAAVPILGTPILWTHRPRFEDVGCLLILLLLFLRFKDHFKDAC